MYGIEIRNPKYVNKEFFDFLRAHGLGCVLLDGYFMPPIGEVAGKFDVRTAGFLVIRLHGPDRANIEEQTGGAWDEIVDPHDHGLHAAAELLVMSPPHHVYPAKCRISRTFARISREYAGGLRRLKRLLIASTMPLAHNSPSSSVKTLSQSGGRPIRRTSIPEYSPRGGQQLAEKLLPSRMRIAKGKRWQRPLVG